MVIMRAYILALLLCPPVSILSHLMCSYICCVYISARYLRRLISVRKIYEHKPTCSISINCTNTHLSVETAHAFAVFDGSEKNTEELILALNTLSIYLYLYSIHTKYIKTYMYIYLYNLCFFYNVVNPYTAIPYS